VNSPKMRLLVFSIIILILFCISWLLSKDVLERMPPLHVAGLRMAVTAVTLWLVAAYAARRHVGPRRPKNMWPRFLSLSVFGFSWYFGSSFMALQVMTASELTVVLALIPGITYVLGLLLRNVYFSWMKSSGVLLVTAAALAFNGAILGGDLHIGGLALALSAAVSYAIYGLLSRRWLADLPLLPSLAQIVTLATASFVPLFILDAAPLALLTTDAALKIAIMGVFCSAPVYILYQKIIVTGGVVYANAIGLLAPFFLYLVEIFMAPDMRLDVIKILSILLVMLGTYLLFFDALGQSPSAPSIIKKTDTP